MTKLKAQVPDYLIKTIRLDNAGEFTSQTLNDYYMSIGINIEHLVAHVLESSDKKMQRKKKKN